MVTVRVLGDNDNTLGSLRGDFMCDLTYREPGIGRLAAGHCHSIIVENFVGNVHFGGGSRTYRQQPAVGVRAIAHIDKDMLLARKGCLRNPIDAFASHLHLEARLPERHYRRHVMTARSAESAASRGDIGRGVRWAYGADEGLSLK